MMRACADPSSRPTAITVSARIVINIICNGRVLLKNMPLNEARRALETIVTIAFRRRTGARAHVLPYSEIDRCETREYRGALLRRVARSPRPPVENGKLQSWLARGGVWDRHRLAADIVAATRG